MLLLARESISALHFMLAFPSLRLAVSSWCRMLLFACLLTKHIQTLFFIHCSGLQSVSELTLKL